MFTSFLLLLWGLISLPIGVMKALRDSEPGIRVTEVVSIKGDIVTRSIRKSYIIK
jgi:hypothetical protein